MSLSFQHGLIKPLECHAMLSVEKKYISLSVASVPFVINTTASASPDSSLYSKRTNNNNVLCKGKIIKQDNHKFPDHHRCLSDIMNMYRVI